MDVPLTSGKLVTQIRTPHSGGRRKLHINNVILRPLSFQKTKKNVQPPTRASTIEAAATGAHRGTTRAGAREREKKASEKKTGDRVSGALAPGTNRRPVRV